MRSFAILCLILLSGQLLAQRVGINTTSPTEPLDVNGNANFRNLLKINGNAGTAGQVLTSNGGAADPAWMSTAFTGNGKFYCTIANNSKNTNGGSGRAKWNLGVGTAQEDSVDFAVAVVTGNDITVNNSGQENNYIEINTAGLYHFEGVMRYFVTSALSVEMLSRATMQMSISQAGLAIHDPYLEETRMEKTGGAETSTATNQYNLTAKFSITINLKQGATIAFITGFNNLRYPGGTDLIAMGVSAGGYIAGHFISP